MTDFKELGLSEKLLQGIADLGFEIPTPVQAAVIPKLLGSARDLIAQAQTGTGKTAAFGLPVLQRVDMSSSETQALILAPTRELCMQINRDLETYARQLPGIRIVPVYGGAAIDKQIRAVKRGAHIVVATPGRLNDLLRRSVVDLSTASVVILDEADEMLNMGFLEDLETILSHLPDTAQTLLFSATMPKSVSTIAKKYMTDAESVVVGTKNAGADNVTHDIYMVHAHDRYAALRRIIDFHPNLYGIIFCRTRAETADVANRLMKDGYSADVLHGDLSQTQRDAAMNRFRLRNVHMLVATDVAARGLDVDDLTHVLNYNLPDQPEIYTHRSGRTGRAGRMGISVSFIHMREKYKLKQIEKVLQKKLTLKPVPSGDEVCGAQLQGLIERVRETEVDHARLSPHIDTAMMMLEGMDRESVIKHFVSLEFNRFLKQYSKAADLNIRAVKSGEHAGRKAHQTSVSLRMNVGKQDGLEPRELIDVINDVTQGRRVAIGRISVKNNFTIFEVEKGEGEAVASALSGLHYEDQVIEVKVAGEGGPIEPGGSRGGGRSGGPPRGRPGKSRGKRPGPKRGRRR